MTNKTDKPKPLYQQTDEEIITTIFERYRGKFVDLNFEHPDVKSQLALDIGMLVGLAARLLRERRACERLDDGSLLLRLVDGSTVTIPAGEQFIAR